MNSELTNLLQTEFTRKHYAKGSVIVREGQICQYLYFVEKGLALPNCRTKSPASIFHAFFVSS